MNTYNTEIFRAVKVLYMILSRWVHDLMHLSKNYTTQRMNSNVYYEL